jgi:predicted phage-related endonuclease
MGLTQEQIAERRKGIGGSDHTGIHNVEPWGCRLRVWFEKRNAEPDYMPESTPDMDRGTILEPIVADLWALETGRKVRRHGKTRNAVGLPAWWRFNIDRHIVANGDDPRGPGVLEIKCPRSFRFARLARKEAPPDEWMLQVQHYMGGLGWTWGEIAMFNADSWTLRRWYVERDDDLIGKMIVEGERFMREVENGPQPPTKDPSYPACKRCQFRDRCHGVDVLTMGDVDAAVAEGDLVLDDSAELDSLIREHDEIAAVGSDAKNMLDDVKDRIKAHLGGPKRVKCGDRKVYVIESERERLDTKALKTRHPDLAKQLTTISKSTSVRVY